MCVGNATLCSIAKVVSYATAEDIILNAEEQSLCKLGEVSEQGLL